MGLAGAGAAGRLRAAALAASGAADVVAIADPDPVARGAALAFAPRARPAPVFDALLEQELDGLILATPAALRTDHAVAALERGLAVYCLSPAGSTEAETRRVFAAARSSDRPFRGDRWFQHVRAARVVRDLIRNDAIGRIQEIDLVFPGTWPAEWNGDRGAANPFRELGADLLDLALWAQDFPRIETVELCSDPRRSDLGTRAQLRLTGKVTVRLTGSRDASGESGATIQAAFRGSRAEAIVRNVAGSRVQFVALLRDGERRHTLIDGPDDWGRRAMVRWAFELRQGASYDPAEETVLAISAALDRLAGLPRRVVPHTPPQASQRPARHASVG